MQAVCLVVLVVIICVIIFWILIKKRANLRKKKERERETDRNDSNTGASEYECINQESIILNKELSTKKSKIEFQQNMAYGPLNIPNRECEDESARELGQNLEYETVAVGELK